MTIKELRDQLTYLLDNNYATEEDELVIIGSGDRQSDYIRCGLCIPKIQLKNDAKPATGYYGLGIIDKTY